MKKLFMIFAFYNHHLYPFSTVDDFLNELLLLSELALLLVEPREFVEAKDLNELIFESSLNAWLGLLKDGTIK